MKRDESSKKKLCFRLPSSAAQRRKAESGQVKVTIRWFSDFQVSQRKGRVRKEKVWMNGFDGCQASDSEVHSGRWKGRMWEAKFRRVSFRAVTTFLGAKLKLILEVLMLAIFKWLKVKCFRDYSQILVKKLYLIFFICIYLHWLLGDITNAI